MGRATSYAFGGVGFSVQASETVVEVSARPDNQFTIEGAADPSALTDVRLALERLASQSSTPGFKVQIQNTPPTHSGFGSKTSLILSVLEAASLAADLSISRHELVALSGRGGASGIGVNSYFVGGMVWDYGHPIQEVDELLPSSLRRPTDLPLRAQTTAFPACWRILLALPSGNHVSGSDEARFFRESTPVKRADALNVIACVHHGVIPAVLSARLPDLQVALKTIQGIGMKRLEVERQPGSAALLKELQVLGFACGMSSLGPLVYAVVHAADQESKREFIHQCALKTAHYLGCFRAGEGREVLSG